jgi:DNA-binding response OmpR family regulator
MSARVLVVEDDNTIRALLRLLLEDEGYVVAEAPTGAVALESMRRQDVDLVLLDLRLPGLSGFEVCREIRKFSEVPIIIVSAQQDSHDVVAGLELGADDYMTKPFNDRELIARIHVQLRPRAHDQLDPMSFGDMEIRPSEGAVFKAGEAVGLTKTEFHLLCKLATQPGRVWSRRQLLDEVWDHPLEGDGRLVDTHIARLRSKVEANPSQPIHVVTVRGLGYKLAH